tara:strand:- start:1729 stop:2397 length:669 start_codon:yes stop_codon:yes gene_type:complete
MSGQMDKLMAMVNEMSDEKTISLQKENDELKKTIDELTKKLTDIQNILIPEVIPEDTSSVPTDDEVDSLWEEVVVKPKKPKMRKVHHTPSHTRGTDTSHNPASNEKVQELCHRFNYTLPKMEVIEGGFMSPGYLPYDTTWNYEFGKVVPRHSKLSPYFKTNMCQAVLHGYDCDGRNNCVDITPPTCFYAHKVEDLIPFRKFTYGVECEPSGLSRAETRKKPQ